MNRILHFKQDNTQQVYLTSDLHLRHNPNWDVPLWKSRGYGSSDEMTDNVIISINAVVRPNDILFMLGDFCLNTSESQFESLLSRINCQNMYVLFGNHNSQIWPIYQREVKKMLNQTEFVECLQEIYPFRYRNVVFIGNYAEIVVDGYNCVLSHYPISSWNGMSHNSFMAHGHIHATKETYKLEGKTIDVGYDYWKRPVPFNEIKLLMDKIPKKSEGHH